MPKVTLNIGNASDLAKVDAAGGYDNYSGPVPPKGVYRTQIKRWVYKTSQAGNPMFSIIFEIQDPEKSQYNGYAIWHNATLTEKSAPFVNAMLDGIGASRALWTKGFVTNPDDVGQNDQRVTNIPGLGNPIGKIVEVSTKVRPARGDYDASLQVSEFLGAAEEDDDAYDAAADVEEEQAAEEAEPTDDFDDGEDF